MELIPCFCFATMFIGIFTLVFLYSKHVKKQLAATLMSIAPKVQGEVQPGGFFGNPRLLFSYLGAPGRLEFYSTGGKHKTYYTQLFIDLTGLPMFAFRVSPEGFLGKIGKFFGGQDIQIGNQPFDDAFVIKGEPEQAVCRLLQPHVCQAIFALRQFRSQHIEIATVGNQLRFRKLQWIRDAEGLGYFLDQAEVVFRQYLMDIAQGG